MKRSFGLSMGVNVLNVAMLTQDEVKHISLLSRIGLTDDEIPTYQKDLSAVFDFFRELETLATDSIEPIGHITGRTDVMRSDEQVAFENSGKTQILKNAPETKDNFLKVRSVF